MSTGTPEQVLKSIVDGINTGNLDALMTLYEPDAGFAGRPGSLAHGLAGVRQGLAGFIAMKGTLDLKVTTVLQASDLALVVGMWSFTGTGPDGGAVKLTGHNADVLRGQADGSWRFVIDNPWGNELNVAIPAAKRHPVRSRAGAGDSLNCVSPSDLCRASPGRNEV
jgi:uncharacterized protein (TIGR02246 family)